MSVSRAVTAALIEEGERHRMMIEEKYFDRLSALATRGCVPEDREDVELMMLCTSLVAGEIYLQKCVRLHEEREGP